MAFLRGQEGWLRQTLAAMPMAIVQPVALGSAVPVEGRLLTLVLGAGRSIRAEGGHLLIPGSPALAPVRLEAWLKVLARDRLLRASDHHAALIGRRFTKLTLRDTRSRWGSCSHDGGLMYSWRLIMAPPSVLDYVAAHEVAHLAEMNHSAAFWRVVDRLCPGWKTERDWLRGEGQGLHHYRFWD